MIQCLIKRYTKHGLNEINGPVTVVAGKKRRLTFIECSSDINAMIDVAKVADLILMTIDASFGFEMETFEFLNILQAHGFPKVMGILTHLDSPKFKVNNGGAKKLRRVKKTLKQRFWTEIYQGAKLFYLSGLINGKYPKTEILNLSRFISVMKFRPLIWRNTHPYFLSDRFEDLTPEAEIQESGKKCDRTVALYGYLRGSNMRDKSNIHIPGVGDLKIEEITALPDPCPAVGGVSEAKDKENKKAVKKLDQRQKMIYAPMSDVGGILYDKDAVYISVPGNFSKNDADDDEDWEAREQRTEGEKMVINMQEANTTLADQLAKTEIQLFSKSKPVTGDSLPTLCQEEIVVENGRSRRRVMFGDEEEHDSDAENDYDGESDGESDAGDFDDEKYGELDAGECDDEETVFGHYENVVSNGAVAEFAESDDDLGEISDRDLSEGESDDDEIETAKWKVGLVENARANHESRKKTNLMDMVYGNTVEEIEERHSNSLQTDIFKPVHRVVKRINDQVDNAKAEVSSPALDAWETEEVLESIRNRFITGEIGENGATVEPENEDDGFEDLEADDGNASKQEEDENELEPAKVMTPEEELALKKEDLKKQFDAEYDGENFDDDAEKKKTYFEEVKESINVQNDINLKEFENDSPELRAKVEGQRAGQYVRVLIKHVPAEFSENFDPHYPVIVGGVLANEDRFGFVQVRIKGHRWTKKVLKNNDPLIFSLGWRRFQSLPIYSLNDGTRNRMLKYTPEHMHCLATFYGPITPPNTGFCCVQTVHESTSRFKIAATGVVLDIDQHVEIVKKLKLTGHPMKVYRNTAFVKDMFTSALEVAKFEGASIRTVSGIRGQVKKHMKTPEGAFRATFEDKVLMSDIVFLRAWYPIKPKVYYNPVTNMLLANDQKSEWRGMRLMRQLRRDHNVPIDTHIDSLYREIEERPEVRKFNTLKIPRALQKELPFSSKPKQIKARSSNHQTYLQRRAVALMPEEKKIYALMQQIYTVKNEKDEKRKVKQAENKQVYLKKKSKEDAKTAELIKQDKRSYFRKVGQEESRKRKSAGVSSAAFVKRSRSS